MSKVEAGGYGGEGGMSDATGTITFKTPKSLLITGSAGTGKTEMLVQRVADLLGQGIAPEELLVLCPTPPASVSFRARLETRLGLAGRDVRVCTARQLALEILKQEDAFKWAGRCARLLAPFETQFLLEDLKTLGLRPKRLREMLNFFYRSWTELAEDDPNWLLTVEEQQLHNLLLEELTLMQGMLEPELAKNAVRWLRDNPVALQAVQVPYVLLDDLQCSSRSSQLLAHLLAASSLTATADCNGCGKAFDSFPYLAGIDEFLQINPAAEHRTLLISHKAPAVAAVLNRLLEDDCMDHSQQTSIDETTVLTAPDISGYCYPDEEFSGVAKRIQSLIDSGDCRPGELAVVAFKRQWAVQTYRHLRQSGVPVVRISAESRLTGDLRDLDKAVALRIYTALRLVADPQDPGAWRCWCGYGDYLANSAGFLDIRELMRTSAKDAGTKTDCSLIDVLEALDCGELACPASAGRILSAYREGKTLVVDCQGFTGNALLGRLTALVSKTAKATVPPVLTALFASTQDLNAAEMVALVEKRLFFPTLETRDEAVCVIDPELLCSQNFSKLVVVGFVNGFLPSLDYFDTTKTSLEKQIKQHGLDVHRLYQALSAAKDEILISYFTRIDLENAGRLQLKAARIRLEQGKRICVVAPSELLDLLTP